MKKFVTLLSIVSILFISCANKNAQVMNDNNTIAPKQSGNIIPSDSYNTGKDSLYVTLVGHGSLMFEYDGKIIHIDPYSAVADYSQLPKADLILITHEHSDHLDSTAIAAIKKENTQFIVSKVCNEQLGYGDIMNNRDKKQWEGIGIDAIPAYNIINKRPDGEAFHPKGRGNGYILMFDSLRVYVAGDTENIPEMDNLKNSIDIAFLPKNLPYTMTDDMFVDAAKKILPKYLYPYHFSEFDESKINSALQDTNIALLVRPMTNK